MGNTCPSPAGLPAEPISCGDIVTVTVSNGLPDKVYTIPLDSGGKRNMYNFKTCGLTLVDTSMSLWDSDFNQLSCIDDKCDLQTQLSVSPDFRCYGGDILYLVPSTYVGDDGVYQMELNCEKISGKQQPECKQRLNQKCQDFCKGTDEFDFGECMHVCPVCCNPAGQEGRTKIYDTEDGSTTSAAICLCKLLFAETPVGECLRDGFISDGFGVNCNI
jgi:hypothetical protein